MDDITFINDNFIEKNTNFIDLIEVLKTAFAQSSIEVPMRHHHDFDNPKEDKSSTLLLMPAWNPGKVSGVKIVTVSPNNGKYNLPAIHGTYIYLDAHKGTVKGILDAKSLTSKRTAAASALASSYLSKEDASSMLMIGTGTLAPNLILAHASVRPIKKVFVWGLSLEKSQRLCNQLKNEDFEIGIVNTIEEVISKVDIVSCATLSPTPLVLGKHLKPGQHIDLVGAFQKHTREADDEAVLKSSVYVDTFEAGLKESGDIVIPLAKGIITEDDVLGDLFELCGNKKIGRISNDEITFFKSVGHGLEDLAAASYYYKKFNDE